MDHYMALRPLNLKNNISFTRRPHHRGVRQLHQKDKIPNLVLLQPVPGGEIQFLFMVEYRNYMCFSKDSPYFIRTASN
jgi:hypothetical protein